MVEVIQDRERVFPGGPGFSEISGGLVRVAEAPESLGIATVVADLAARLRAHRPEWSERRRHDELLAHGSPAARHLRSLLLTLPRRLGR